ncbi:MAG: flagellar hook-basal body complex protein FliE [Rhodobacteraceae bacterium]|nr:flagellar hook-basal body complex protein FliE [Paracoccaceae bacterium]
MDVKFTHAVQNYAKARPATEAVPSGQSAGELAGDLAGDFAASLNATDKAAQDTLVKGADPHTLVEALAQTQLAVETAVTVRDKVVEAYQEILRMPV